MRKERMFGMITFGIILLSMLSLPQGFARGAGLYRPYASQVFQAVSDPSTDCVHITFVPDAFPYTGNHGLVIIANAYQAVHLQNANQTVSTACQ